MALNDDDLKARMNRFVPPTAAILGQEILEIDSAAGRVKMKFQPIDACRNPMGNVQGGIVVANPVPAHLGWEKEEHDRVVAKAFAAADLAGVRGKAVTPFLLQFIVEESKGRSLEVNLDLAKNNVSLAAQIAIAYSEQAE